MEAALHGVERAFYISPVSQPDEAEMGVGFVAAAERAGVRRIVFSSVIHPTLALRKHAAKAPTADALISPGLDFTLLQPAVFYQNLAAAWPAVVAGGVLAEPFSDTARIARVDYRDVADVAATALSEDRLLDGTFELCADGGLDRRQVAAIMSDVLGRPVTAASPGFEDWAAKVKLPYDEQQKGQLAAMYEHYDRHGAGRKIKARALPWTRLRRSLKNPIIGWFSEAWRWRVLGSAIGCRT